MSHEEALKAVLAGGPVPADLASHVASCPACGAELAALRHLEAAVARSRPETLGDPAWEEKVRHALRRGEARRGGWARPSQAWLTAAASALLAVGLLAGWLSLRQPPSPAPAGAAALAARAWIAAPPDTGMPLWEETGEDSTASLLQAAESYAQRVQSADAAEDGQVLDLFDNGGWNG